LPQAVERKILAAAIFFLLSALAAASKLQLEDGASIVDSGSTNTEGFKVNVWSTGRARILSAGGSGLAHIDGELSRKFLADLKAARNSNAQGQPCVKSASFGTRTTVVWHGWTSPDLQCPVAGPLTAVKADADAIVRQLHISLRPQRTIHLPRNEPRAVPPMPSPSKRLLPSS